MQHTDNPVPTPQPPSLLDYLEVIAKRWKMIVGITFTAAVITAIITLFMPNIYTARAMIIPSDDDKGGMGALMAQLGGLAGLAGGAVGAKTTGDLYVTMLKSETLKDPIIDRFKLLDVYEAKFRTDVYNTLNKNAVISLGKKDGVISIAVNDTDPKRAADMANAYVEELGKMAAGLNMTGAGKNRAFLEKRISEARAELSRAEEGLKAFQSKNKAISVTDQAQATIAGVAQLRAQLALKEVELGTYQRQFTDSSQEVKTTKATVSNLRSQIAGLEGKGGGSSSIPSVGNMPQLSQDYLQLMREFKIQEAVVEMLTKQYEVAKISEVKEVVPFQILQKAKVPERKSGPARRKMVTFSSFAVFFFSLLWSFFQKNYSQMSDMNKQRWQGVLKFKRIT